MIIIKYTKLDCCQKIDEQRFKSKKGKLIANFTLLKRSVTFVESSSIYRPSDLIIWRFFGRDLLWLSAPRGAGITTSGNGWIIKENTQ